MNTFKKFSIPMMLVSATIGSFPQFSAAQSDQGSLQSILDIANSEAFDVKTAALKIDAQSEAYLGARQKLLTPSVTGQVTPKLGFGGEYTTGVSATASWSGFNGALRENMKAQKSLITFTKFDYLT